MILLFLAHTAQSALTLSHIGCFAGVKAFGQFPPQESPTWGWQALMQKRRNMKYQPLSHTCTMIFIRQPRGQLVAERFAFENRVLARARKAALVAVSRLEGHMQYHARLSRSTDKSRCVLATGMMFCSIPAVKIVSVSLLVTIWSTTISPVVARDSRHAEADER